MRTAGVIARVWLKGNHSRRAARKEHRENALETTYVVHHFARKIQAGEKSFLGRIAPAEREKREKRFLTSLDLTGKVVYDVGGFEGVLTMKPPTSYTTLPVRSRLVRNLFSAVSPQPSGRNASPPLRRMPAASPVRIV